jgi:hypothetical protein
LKESGHEQNKQSNSARYSMNPSHDRNPIPNNPFLPRYNELTLFLMGLSFVLLYLTYPDLRSLAGDFLRSDHSFDYRRYLFVGLFGLGILFSLTHILIRRAKSSFEKFVMLFFAVVVNGYSGIAAGAHLIKEARGLLMIFPLCNILSGAILLILYRLHVINEKCIEDDDATILQVIVGSAVVIVTLAVCSAYQMYWAITFSICVAYATNFNDVLQYVLGLRKFKYPPRRRDG